MNCFSCEKNDGACYTSDPPQYKCTLDGTFHNGNDSCDLYDKGYQKGRREVIDEILSMCGGKCEVCRWVIADEGNVCGCIIEQLKEQNK